jgi:hypothetical protein
VYLLYSWCQVTIRTSVLLFFIRIFAIGTARRLFWTILIVSNSLHLGFVLFNIFQCTPISHFWEQWHGESDGSCVGPNIVSLSGAVFDMLWTLVILIAPMPFVLRLNLPRHKKFAVAVMFAWGILYVELSSAALVQRQCGRYKLEVSLTVCIVRLPSCVTDTKPSSTMVPTTTQLVSRRTISRFFK